MKTESQYFGEVDMVQITGNLTHEKSIANVTFSRVTKYNTLEEITITLTRELAHRLSVHLDDALKGDGEIFVEFS